MGSLLDTFHVLKRQGYHVKHLFPLFEQKVGILDKKRGYQNILIKLSNLTKETLLTHFFWLT